MHHASTSNELIIPPILDSDVTCPWHGDVSPQAAHILILVLNAVAHPISNSQQRSEGISMGLGATPSFVLLVSGCYVASRIGNLASTPKSRYLPGTLRIRSLASVHTRAADLKVSIVQERSPDKADLERVWEERSRCLTLVRSRFVISY